MNVEESVASLKAVIRDVPDFPKPGIVFKDITTLLKNPQAFRRALDLFTVLCGDHLADKVVAIESRGFIVGATLADRLGLGFVPLRKPGKLPGQTLRYTYDLEYGQDCLEIHEDALTPGRPRPDRGRRDRDRGHGPRRGRAGGEAGRHRRRLRVPGRAELPRTVGRGSTGDVLSLIRY